MNFTIGLQPGVDIAVVIWFCCHMRMGVITYSANTYTYGSNIGPTWAPPSFTWVPLGNSCGNGSGFHMESTWTSPGVLCIIHGHHMEAMCHPESSDLPSPQTADPEPSLLRQTGRPRRVGAARSQLHHRVAPVPGAALPGLARGEGQRQLPGAGQPDQAGRRAGPIPAALPAPGHHR